MAPATTLDPYTRLLASLADVASKARQSLPTSFGGRLLMWSVVWSVGAWTLVALLLWSPLIITCAIAYAFYHAAVWLGALLEALFNAAVDRLAEWKVGIWAARKEARVMKSVRRAASDDGFMRSVLGGLPGVDAERVMQRIDSLTRFSVADRESQEEVGGGRVRRSRTEGGAEGSDQEEVDDEEEVGEVVSDCDIADARVSKGKSRGGGGEDGRVKKGGWGAARRGGTGGAALPRGTGNRNGDDSEDGLVQQRGVRAVHSVEDFEIEEVDEVGGGGAAHARLRKKTGGDLLLELVRKGYMVMMTGQQERR